LTKINNTGNGNNANNANNTRNTNNAKNTIIINFAKGASRTGSRSTMGGEKLAD